MKNKKVSYTQNISSEFYEEVYNDDENSYTWDLIPKDFKKGIKLDVFFNKNIWKYELEIFWDKKAFLILSKFFRHF